MRTTQCLRHASTISTKPHFNPYNALTQVFPVVPERESGNPKGLVALRYAAKENICTQMGVTTCSSRILGAKSDNPYASPFDATCISLLSAAGASLVAKTNMDEFGMGSFTTNTPYGPTVNPHAHDRTAGGSSGGSAAALYVRSDDFPQLDFTLGTDTGGSVRIPASYCGLYGFKPTYGRISRWGIVPYANSLDTVGILTSKEAGIDRLRQVYNILDQCDTQDPTSLSIKTRARIGSHFRGEKSGKLRIGIPLEYNILELSPAIRDQWLASLDHLAENGCEIVPVTLPLTEAALAAYYILAPAEASSNLQKYSGVFYGTRSDADREAGRLYVSTRDLFGDEVKRRILMGCISLSASRFDNYYLQAQRVRQLVVNDFNRIFNLAHPLIPSQRGNNGVDYLLTPVAPTVAPLLVDVEKMTSAQAHAGDVFTVPASLAGLPALSVPFGGDETGLPIGIQLIGQYGDDQGLLELARRLV